MPSMCWRCNRANPACADNTPYFLSSQLLRARTTLFVTTPNHHSAPPPPYPRARRALCPCTACVLLSSPTPSSLPRVTPSLPPACIAITLRRRPSRLWSTLCCSVSSHARSVSACARAVHARLTTLSAVTFIVIHLAPALPASLRARESQSPAIITTRARCPLLAAPVALCRLLCAARASLRCSLVDDAGARAPGRGAAALRWQWRAVGIRVRAGVPLAPSPPRAHARARLLRSPSVSTRAVCGLRAAPRRNAPQLRALFFAPRPHLPSLCAGKQQQPALLATAPPLRACAPSCIASLPPRAR